MAAVGDAKKSDTKEAAVTKPLAFTVTELKVPMLAFTVASVVAKDPATDVISPVKAGC